VEFDGCRGVGDITEQTFLLDSCPVGEVIAVCYADVSYDPQRNDSVDTPLCSWERATCRRSVLRHEAILQCNGQRTCTINQTILDFPQGNESRLCDQYENGNFLDVVYLCLPGT